jgi:murein DD-endopeptidase MepM/ murein hydrolase activator NlpD
MSARSTLLRTVRKHWLAYGLYVLLGIAGLITAVWATWLNVSAARTSDGLRLGGGASQRATTIPNLPEFVPSASETSLLRQANIYTEFPVRPRIEVVRYTVQPGDSVFGIADEFNIQPETLLMGNYSTLNDDPHMLSPGQELNILPTDGAYYKWRESDFLPMVANRFHVEVEDILDWVGNDLDPVNPEIDPGTWIMIPGGSRLLTPWIIPTIARGSAGVGAALGPGGCSGDFSGGAVGTGGFIWPTSRHDVVGNDYWSGHLAIDLAVGVGEAVWAADGGVIVYSGWSYGGYGNVVMIDHGNGWVTLYGHLNGVAVGCGQSVAKGQTIGWGGSTGNSTGPHLHFETRSGGGFVNPYYVLP